MSIYLARRGGTWIFVPLVLHHRKGDMLVVHLVKQCHQAQISLFVL